MCTHKKHIAVIADSSANYIGKSNIKHALTLAIGCAWGLVLAAVIVMLLLKVISFGFARDDAYEAAKQEAYYASIERRAGR